MADWAGQANQIFDPQYASEKAQLDTGHTQTLASYDTEQKSIDPYYTQAESNLKEARANEGAKQDLVYSTALSGNTSGLLGNEQRILGEHYLQNVTNLETERANKLADISTRRTNENQAYDTNVGALGSKYQGLKSQYIIAGQQSDEANARAEAARVESENFQREMARENAALQLNLAHINNSGSSSSSGGGVDRNAYNSDLKQLESALSTGYKSLNAGKDYKSLMPTKPVAKQQLIDKYKGIISPQEISGYVDQLYARHRGDH